MNEFDFDPASTIFPKKRFQHKLKNFRKNAGDWAEYEAELDPVGGRPAAEEDRGARQATSHGCHPTRGLLFHTIQ